jgi:hypothetical protein
VVAVGILAVERAVGGHKLLGVVDARVSEVKVGDTVKIRGDVALLSRPLGLKIEKQENINPNNPKGLSSGIIKMTLTPLMVLSR